MLGQQQHLRLSLAPLYLSLFRHLLVPHTCLPLTHLHHSFSHSSNTPLHPTHPPQHNTPQVPMKTIASNAGVEGAVIIGKVEEQAEPNMGYNAATDEFTDMVSEHEGPGVCFGTKLRSTKSWLLSTMLGANSRTKGARGPLSAEPPGNGVHTPTLSLTLWITPTHMTLTPFPLPLSHTYSARSRPASLTP